MKTKTIDDIENNHVFLDRVADADLALEKSLCQANFEITSPAGFTASDNVTVQKIKILDKVIGNSENSLFLNIYPNSSPLYNCSPAHNINLTHLFKISPGARGKVELLFLAGTNNGSNVLFLRDDIDHAIQAAVEYSGEANKWYEKIRIVRDKISEAENEANDLITARAIGLRQLAEQLNNRAPVEREL